MAKCPAGTDIRAYNYLMQTGRIDAAAAKLRERNPFPAITGRVCPHQCEGECSRAKVDGAVNINALEQYLGDRSLAEKPQKPRIRHAQKVAVAGSGPAGLSCAWFLAAKGYQVKVFEALPEPGGMLRYGIPAYRLPDAVVDAQVEQLRALGVEFQCGTRVGKDCDVSFDDLSELGFKALFVAPGNGISRRAGVAGENLAGVFHGVEFLRDVRMGRARRLSGRAVVIGGGDVAVDAAITAKLLGAAEVDMICLEQAGEMPAFPHNIHDAQAAGIGILPGWGALRVEGDKRVSGITVRRCLAVFDEQHRFSPKFDEADTRHFAAETVIFAIGQSADLTPFAERISVEGGRIPVDAVTFATSFWNIFAAGDAVTGPSSVISAIAGGREAAISIDRLLSGAHMHSERAETRPLAEKLPGEGVRPAPRHERRDGTPASFAECRSGLDDIDALDESMRCLTCGAKARVSFRDDCMTCFFCELRCPSEAIDVHPFKERLPYTLETNFGGF